MIGQIVKTMVRFSAHHLHIFRNHVGREDGESLGLFFLSRFQAACTQIAIRCIVLACTQFFMLSVMIQQCCGEAFTEKRFFRLAVFF